MTVQVSKARSFWKEENGGLSSLLQSPPPGPWQESGHGPGAAETPRKVPELFLERTSGTFLCTKDGGNPGCLWKQLERLMGWVSQGSCDGPVLGIVQSGRGGLGD